MPKLKVPRKSTSIDMTAMCDVAFLLLSFFIFTAKMKKSTEIEIENPTSVATDTIGIKNKFNVTVNIGEDGKVLIGMDNDSLMEDLGKRVAAAKGFSFTDAELAALKKRTSLGMDFNELKPFFAKAATGADMPPQPGIPLPKDLKTDTAAIQLLDWVKIAGYDMFNAAKDAYKDDETKRIVETYATIYVNADKKAPWVVVDKVMSIFAKLKLDRFRLLTTLEDTPKGSDLEKVREKEMAEAIKEAANKPAEKEQQ